MSSPVIRRTPVRNGQVVGTQQLTPRMRRITVGSEAGVGLVVRPAQDIELLLREASGRRVKRRYTIRHARPGSGEFDLDVLLHGEGPGAQWGARAEPGDAVEYQGPRGKLELRSAPCHLLIGDESALPAIAAICEALPAAERAVAVIEVQDGDDELPVAADTHWVHRRSAAAGTPNLLAAAARELDVPDGTRGYLMGESRAMVALRAVLEGRGIDSNAIFVKGYWNIGRPDRLAGRAPTGG